MKFNRTKNKPMSIVLTLIITAIAISSCNLLPAECSSDLAFSASNMSKIKRYKGCEATVSGLVYTTYMPESKKVFFINLGNPDYQKAFTGVIFQSDFDNFNQSLDNYEGKKISIYGTIETYEDRPQIIIKYPEQIEIIE